MSDADPRPLAAETTTTASPDAVWAVVSDVRRTGEWSPECRHVRLLGRLRHGALLLGSNKRGRVRWVTLSRVIAVEPGRAVAWRVLTNRSEWRYEIDSSPAGTRIVQTRRTPRGEGRFALWFTRAFLGGQAGHDDELEAGMADGLHAIARLAEAGTRATSAG